jgi:hypothetical protein
MNATIIPQPKAPAPPVPPPLRPGVGARLTSNELGQSLDFTAPGASYPHPWRPSLSRAGVRLTRGLINGQWEPVINGVKLSARTQPVLALKPELATDAGESWVCVEVEPDALGEITKDSRVEIVHRNQPRSLDPQIGCEALVQILWRGRTPLAAFELVHFNLRYTRVLPAGKTLDQVLAEHLRVTHLFY